MSHNDLSLHELQCGSSVTCGCVERIASESSDGGEKGVTGCGRAWVLLQARDADSMYEVDWVWRSEDVEARLVGGTSQQGHGCRARNSSSILPQNHPCFTIVFCLHCTPQVPLSNHSTHLRLFFP